MPEVEVTV